MAKATKQDKSEFETGFNVGQVVTFAGKPGTVRQIVVTHADELMLLVDFGGSPADERQIPALAVS